MQPLTRTALITGITGQDGSYLAELLVGKGYDVHGLIRSSSEQSLGRVEHLRDLLTIHRGDLLDQVSISAALNESAPDEVYNLAATSSVASSWTDPILAAELSGVAVARMLQEVLRICPGARFYQASSSEMFGDVAELPQTEATPCHPKTPYGAAKAYGHFITVSYREALGLHATSGILFNHESPRRGLEFVTRKISWHAAAIKLGLADKLALGNLDSERDWGYAKDYVEAMWLMVQQDDAKDYVIATGENHSVRECVEIAFDEAGLGDFQQYVEIDPQFARPADPNRLVGDASRAERDLGWKPTTSFENLIRLMVREDFELLST